MKSQVQGWKIKAQFSSLLRLLPETGQADNALNPEPPLLRASIIEQPIRSLDVAKRNRGIAVAVGTETQQQTQPQRSAIEELRWGARHAGRRCSFFLSCSV
jgi:hypothetical protein